MTKIVPTGLERARSPRRNGELLVSDLTSDYVIKYRISTIYSLTKEIIN